MTVLSALHRWMGGLIGLFLALLGLSGTLLLFKEDWLRLTLPHASDAPQQDLASLTTIMERAASRAPALPDAVLFASERFGLSRVTTGREAGYYLAQNGDVPARWSSFSDRFELWLFDLHHHLLLGGTGETAAGIMGLIGVGFVITGLILWWRTRKTFAFRLLPARMTRSAVVRHHRDLGVLLSPLLFLSMLTGTMMVLRPVAGLLLSPWSSPAEMRTALAPPDRKGGPLAAKPDWRGMIANAQTRFPGGEIRFIALPRKPGDLIAMRVRQQAEWLPNGRTMLWFDPASSRLVEARDGLKLPSGLQIFNKLYPLHAAKVGGLAYRMFMSLSGLALTLLGTFAVWSFWRPRVARRTNERHNADFPAHGHAS